MRTALACIPCFARQALEAARFATDDPAVHERLLRSVLRSASEMDLSESPPAVAQRIHRLLRELTGVDDPYRTVKDRHNRMALNMLGSFRPAIRSAPDPLEAALRLAVAGNVIDMGVNGEMTEAEARQAVRGGLNEPLHGDVDAFRRVVGEADDVLYLADNAGEIVFDRLLIEQLPPGRVTVAVRGGPVLNDATAEDAETAGLGELAEVIDNGSDAPATVLADCGEDFRRRFARADVILAKGQGNFESLSDVDANIYFLFKAKCSVIADHVGLPLGTHVLLPGRLARGLPGGSHDAAL